jgi:hypothetical protein
LRRATRLGLAVDPNSGGAQGPEGDDPNLDHSCHGISVGYGCRATDEANVCSRLASIIHEAALDATGRKKIPIRALDDSFQALSNDSSQRESSTLRSDRTQFGKLVGRLGVCLV